MTESCYACGQEATLDAAPMPERTYLNELWRVAHAFNTTLPGWLVILPRRHVTSVAALTTAEAAELGPLVHRLSRFCTTCWGAPKPT